MLTKVELCVFQFPHQKKAALQKKYADSINMTNNRLRHIPGGRF